MEANWERTLRWMRNNLLLSRGIFEAGGHYQVDPRLSRVGEAVEFDTTGVGPGDVQWTFNSAAALVALCYIEAMGKVRRQADGLPKGQNKERFRHFLPAHMKDYVQECAAPKAVGSVQLLWDVRNGFAHQFAAKTMGWERAGHVAPYWRSHNGLSVLNIDRLVIGTVRGLDDFAKWYQGGGNTDAQFLAWLGS